MKKTLKTLSMVLAVLLACMSFATFANADAQTGEITHRTEYRPTTEFYVGQEYVIVGKGADADYAMTASTSSNNVSVTPVTVFGRQGILDELSEACVWTAVERGDYICLRNNLTGKYLGSLTDIYTWDSIYGADAVGFSRSGFSMSFIGSTGTIFGSKLHFDEARCKFYLSGQQPPWNVNIYEKHIAEAIPVMPSPELPEPEPITDSVEY